MCCGQQPPEPPEFWEGVAATRWHLPSTPSPSWVSIPSGSGCSQEGRVLVGELGWCMRLQEHITHPPPTSGRAGAEAITGLGGGECSYVQRCACVHTWPVHLRGCLRVCRCARRACQQLCTSGGWGGFGEVVHGWVPGGCPWTLGVGGVVGGGCAPGGRGPGRTRPRRPATIVPAHLPRAFPPPRAPGAPLPDACCPLPAARRPAPLV